MYMSCIINKTVYRRIMVMGGKKGKSKVVAPLGLGVVVVVVVSEANGLQYCMMSQMPRLPNPVCV
jgi:hypothetical protein